MSKNELHDCINDWQCDFDRLKSSIDADDQLQKYEAALRCLTIQDRVAAVILSEILDCTSSYEIVEDLCSENMFDIAAEDVQRIFSDLCCSLNNALMYT